MTPSLFNDSYEESLKDFRDMYSVMKTQLEKGREEGRIEGREEGIAIGAEQATLANAKALIEQGVPRDVVQKALHLTDSQMKEL